MRAGGLSRSDFDRREPHQCLVRQRRRPKRIFTQKDRPLNEGMGNLGS